MSDRMARIARSAGRMRRRAGEDRGQTSFEYLGIVVVIAIIIGVLATTDIGDAILQGITGKIADIVGAG
jgi:hypothetical protein